MFTLCMYAFFFPHIQFDNMAAFPRGLLKYV